MQEHITAIQAIPLANIPSDSQEKILRHLAAAESANKMLDRETSEKCKNIIEFLHSESRSFGWSFRENPAEEVCENAFRIFEKRITRLVGGMSVNERLHYFGYLEEFEKLIRAHPSAGDEILRKLFVK